MQITTIGLDLAKHVFQVHGVDANDAVVEKRRLRRGQVLGYSRSLRRAESAWRPAPPPTSGHGSCAGWGTKCA
jgi:hypothetical protein